MGSGGELSQQGPKVPLGQGAELVNSTLVNNVFFTGCPITFDPRSIPRLGTRARARSATMVRPGQMLLYFHTSLTESSGYFIFDLRY